ncbi:SigE family RNA polymerase sigma factor [Acidiferrimicrobium sp. IK]|uniref:SigE family RNA polymerase sigma factor n=1 Tax=Acidiferrimicrobium sp. IK TaxID=2871700 RepID=UPI0021CB607F|nr:SigE family RNA polymerase sigma factor [Acidiferrimicrobium sp. IK]MCU4187178.1 SigE family RNA polymerase sigma factor [Acidiferrimicrobium sp. IK]
MSAAEEQFRQFVRSRAAPLHRTAYLLCGDWHLADDLVQEALAKTFRHWRRVQLADSPDAYVRRILINEANRHFKRNRHAATPVDVQTRSHDPADPSQPDASGGLARRDLLLAALLALPERQRATVVLRHLEGMTEAETAAILGCSEGTVKSQTFRALHTLNDLITRQESTL